MRTMNLNKTTFLYILTHRGLLLSAVIQLRQYLLQRAEFGYAPTP